MSDSNTPTTEKKEHEDNVTTQQASNAACKTTKSVIYRIMENLFQLIVIIVCIFLGGIISIELLDESKEAVYVGWGIGLLVGLVGSGTLLMIFRSMVHKGDHQD